MRTTSHSSAIPPVVNFHGCRFDQFQRDHRPVLCFPRFDHLADNHGFRLPELSTQEGSIQNACALGYLLPLLCTARHVELQINAHSELPLFDWFYELARFPARNSFLIPNRQRLTQRRYYIQPAERQLTRRGLEIREQLEPEGS